MENENTKKGIIFEIERYAIQDGPGIRTVVFMKGCPLRCLWCANPESYKKKPELVYWENKCISCKTCIKVCPREVIVQKDNGIDINKEKCDLCGKCVEACNSQALVIIGKEMTPSEVLMQILQDEDFYDNSGGGVTFSGGEPFQQAEFLLETAALCKKNYIHTCIETSGFAKPKDIELVSPYIDLFLFDFKNMIDIEHKQQTGVSNELILDNFKQFTLLKKDIVIRVPVIPNMNDSEENYLKLINFLKEHSDCQFVDLLPYHKLGLSKYKRMGIDYKLNSVLPPTSERMEEIRKLFLEKGFKVTIGG